MKYQIVISEIENKWIIGEANFPMCNPENIMGADDLTIKKRVYIK